MIKKKNGVYGFDGHFYFIITVNEAPCQRLSASTNRLSISKDGQLMKLLMLDEVKKDYQRAENQ